MKRVRKARTLTTSDELRIVPSSHHYEPISVSPPLFFIDTAGQTTLLKDFLENPNLRPYQPAILEARNVSVSAPSMVHRWGNCAFIEGLLEDDENIAYPKLVLEFETMPLRSRVDHEVGVLLALPLYNNYFHWLVELLPRLQLLDGWHHLQSYPLLLPAEAPGFVRETLALSGNLARALFLPRGRHQFVRLCIPTLLSPPSHPSPQAILWLRERLLTASTSHLPVPKRRIYVSRRDAPTRYASNERNVEDLLGAFGFETVHMSEYSVQEQIQLFSQAEMIVGLHGAALTNLTFCRPGTYVLELFLEGWFTNAFYHISLIGQLHYGFLVCARDGEGQRVPIDHLKSLVSDMVRHSGEC